MNSLIRFGKLPAQIWFKTSYISYRLLLKFLKFFLRILRFSARSLDKVNADSSLFAALFFGAAIYLYGNKFNPNKKQ